jgi:RNA polymerase sigma factor (sigma-70 family)
MSPPALSLRFLQTQPDERLVELARAGHERAFEALVQRYRRQLLHYCRRLSGSDAGAEDAVQQALLQAWVALSNGTTEVREARAWLYRIAHNVAVSNLRHPGHDPEKVDETDATNGADQEVERRIAVRETLAGLASLPDLQRQVMLSTAFEGRSHDEIAATLGLSHGAVRGLIYRARATLRAAAAVLMPAPFVNWALRQGVGRGPGSAGLAEAIAGGGTAGLGAVLLKGGALVVTAGALASATGLTSSHSGNRSPHRVVASAHLRRAVGSTEASPVPGVSASSLPRTGLFVASGGSARATGSAAQWSGPASSTGATFSSGQSRQSGQSTPVLVLGLGPAGGGGPGKSGPNGQGSGGDHGGGGSGGDGSGGGSLNGASNGSSSSGSSSGNRSGGDHGGGGLSGGGSSGGGSSGGGSTTSGSGGSTTTVSTGQTPSGDSGGGHGGDSSHGGGSGGGGGSDGNVPAAVTTTPVPVTPTPTSGKPGGD